jgi:hypothetical protein
VGQVHDREGEQQTEPLSQSEQHTFVADDSHSSVEDARKRFVFIASSMAIGEREGHGGPPLRGGFGSCGQLCDPSRHKKTTHALHRRLAFLSGLSTADVIRLPN